ncbi:Peptidase M13 and Peptidase M13 N domain containi ng protein [Trichuris trichiura]|uniref:Peptidase M13 and Peptidase M13 N domain containi ng protein n=1 Tax=Trichuris trichiura TaxID=36087 RepID=A0A077ZJE5_TRITR|nr:Peptidase M13 and Peptidase M13 N domain containi ng protein [Trichuris trichiura]
MNLQADPCTDFYEQCFSRYSCGLWSRLNPIEESSAQRTSVTVLADQNSADLKQFLNDLPREPTSNRSIDLLRRVYDACMDEESIENVSSKPLFDLLERAFPGKHKLGNYMENTIPLESLVAKLWLSFGVSSIITPYVSADERNATTNILVLDQAILGLGPRSEDYYLKNGSAYRLIRYAYTEAVKKIFHLISNDKPSDSTNTDDIGRNVDKIINFEIDLARINTPADKRKDHTKMYNKMTISELQATGNKFNWSIFLDKFRPLDYVNVIEPEYIRKMNVLLSETDVDTVYDYLYLRLILSRLEFLERRYSDIYYDFLEAFTSQERIKDRSKYCVAYLTGKSGVAQEFLGYAMGKIFVQRKNFDKESKSDVDKMVTELKNAFNLLLNQNNWMDEPTKQKAKEKIHHMVSTVGYPEEINKLDAIYGPLLKEHDDYHDTVINSNDSFFEINTKMLTWLTQKQNNQIGKPCDRHDFAGSPVIVNAWYAPSRNSIVLPAGILQPPFYDKTFPAAVNFGCIGSVIGHEMTHGFGTRGAEYDSYGNLNVQNCIQYFVYLIHIRHTFYNWWTNSSKEKFEEKVQCFVDQYSHFCYPELGDNVCVKGENTKGENIADNGGIKQSFAAYKALTKGKPQEVLPSLEQFTMDQIFFLSFANFYCGNSTNMFLHKMININEHAPDRTRVVGTLQNFDEFAKAFNCPLGSVMNPEKKCVVW